MVILFCIFIYLFKRFINFQPSILSPFIFITLSLPLSIFFLVGEHTIHASTIFLGRKSRLYIAF